MACATEEDLGGNDWRLYDYITRHFIASLSTDAKYDKIKIKFSLGGEFFSYSGKRIISEGFTSLMPWMKSKDEVKIDMLEKGDQLPVAAVEVKEEQTSPPPYLSESDLISLVRFKFFVRIFDKQKRLVLMLTFALLDGKAWHRY
jgi:DNA topoisomerase-3